MVKKVRVSQRVKLIAETFVSRGYTFGDVTAIIGDNYFFVNGIKPTSTEREILRVGPGDWVPVPGRPVFPHIDGERSGFGANRGNRATVPTTTTQTESDMSTGSTTADLIKVFQNAINEAIEAKVKDGGVSEARVAELVAEAVSRITPKEHIIKLGTLPPVKVEGTPHKLLKRVLSLVACNVSEKNVMLIGPAGSGKTYLAEQVSKVLGLQFSALSFSPGMSESKLFGRVIPRITDGKETYTASPSVVAYRDGGVVLLDELDNGDPSTISSLNAFLANGWMFLPDGSRVVRHPDTVVIGSMNTLGTGANRVYVGRNALDGATLNRFVIELMDYDADLEKALCPEDHIRDAVLAVRKKVADNKLSRIVGTRDLRLVRSLVLGVGDTLPQALKVMTANWSEADRTAVGIR
jgi:cobaltochelatase CobS